MSTGKFTRGFNLRLLSIACQIMPGGKVHTCASFFGKDFTAKE